MLFKVVFEHIGQVLILGAEVVTVNKAVQLNLRCTLGIIFLCLLLIVQIVGTDGARHKYRVAFVACAIEPIDTIPLVELLVNIGFE